MFEIKKKEYSNRSIRMPKELLKRLEAVAKSEGVSVNRVVTQCCEYALEHLNADEKEGQD